MSSDSDSDENSGDRDVFYLSSESDDSEWGYKMSKTRDRKRSSSSSERLHAGTGIRDTCALDSESEYLSGGCEIVETWIIPDAKQNLSDKSSWRQEFKCAHPSVPNVSLSVALFCKNGRGEASQPLFEHSIAFESVNEPQRRCWTKVTAELLREVNDAPVASLLKKVGAHTNRSDFRAPILSRKRKFSEISGKNLSELRPPNASPSDADEAALSVACLNEHPDDELNGNAEDDNVGEGDANKSVEKDPFRDDPMEISPEQMKEQMSDMTDTLTTLERHRKASRLAMADKQKFNAENLFASPGIGLASKEMFARNCVTWSKHSASAIENATASNEVQDMLSAEHNTNAEEAQIPRFDVIDTIQLGPNELSSEVAVQCAAWSLNSLSSALNRDGSLRICLTLTVYDVDKAVRSRDLIRGLHRSGTFSDFIVKVESQQFAVHKCILAAASNELKAILCKNEGEDMLDLTNVASPSGVKAFLALLYHDCYDWSSHKDVMAVVVEVLTLASRFKAENVKEQILAVILKVIDLDNVLRLFEAAIVFDASRVKEACCSFLSSKRSFIQESLCWTQLLEDTPSAEKVRRELLKIFFRRQLCAHSATSIQSVKAKRLGRFPNSEAPLYGVWIIENADSTLKTVSGQPNLHTFYLSTLGPAPQKFEFKLKLFPKGRTKSIAAAGFTSLHLSLVQPRNEYKHCLAYVDVSAGVDGGCGGLKVAVRNVLVEFSRAKALTLDKAWSIEQLHNAIGKDDGSLHVRLDLRLVDAAGVLKCHCMLDDFCRKDVALAKLKKKKLAAVYKQSPEAMGKTVEAVEVLTIKAAKQAIQERNIFSHTFGFTHASLPGVCWTATIRRSRDSTFSIEYSASFLQATGDRHCWTGLTAELERVIEGKIYTINTVKFAARLLIAETGSILGKGTWPLAVFQSAINNDDTLQVRLRLTLYSIEQAIWSRDFIRGLLESGQSSDFAIDVGPSKVSCHKRLLTAASRDLKAKLPNLVRDNVLDLTSLSLTPAGVKAFLSLIYSGVYPWKSDPDLVRTIGDALKIDDELKTSRVQQQIYDVVLEAIDLENALSFFAYAVSSGRPRMKEISFSFLLENSFAVHNSDCIADLLEYSAAGDKLRCEFLRMLFDDKLVAHYSYCTCALPGCANEFAFGGRADAWPNQVRELSEFWSIENAVEKLSEAELSHAFPETNRHATPEWMMRLFPGGRNAQAQFEAMASISVYQPGITKDVCLAYVSSSLEKQDNSRVFATDSDGQTKTLVEFTRSRGLVIDKAWPAAVLRNAVNGENKLCVKVELEMVNVREGVKCFELMRNLLKQRAFTDFALTAEGESFAVQKCILAQRSEIFAAMLSSEMRESAEKMLDLSRTATASCVDAFVGAIYFASANKLSDEAATLELLKLAHQYGLADVKIACDREFAHNVDMENVLEILSVCRLYGLSRSNSACMRYLRDNRIEFLRSTVWKDLKLDGSRCELHGTLIEELLLELPPLALTQRQHDLT